MQFHQRQAIRPVKQSPVCPSPFATVIGSTADYLHTFSIFQPTFHMAFCLLHFAFHHSHITAINDCLSPIGSEHLLYLHTLGIHHQSSGACIQSVNHVRIATLTSIHEVSVKQVFHVKAISPYAHREHLIGLIHHYQIVVFIHYIEKWCIIKASRRPSRMFADFHYHLWLYKKIVSRFHLMLHKHASVC